MVWRNLTIPQRRAGLSNNWKQAPKGDSRFTFARMGCFVSKPPAPSIDTATKNEVDEQLAQMQEEERTHYKVDLKFHGLSPTFGSQQARLRVGRVHELYVSKQPRLMHMWLLLARRCRAYTFIDMSGIG